MGRTKRILMVAPTPYFSDRGCHVQIYEVARSQQLNGNDVRIVTYHHGRDMPDIPTERIPNIPWYTKVSSGPAWHKFYIDVLLMIKTLIVALRYRPDIMHVHMHEGAALTLPIARLLGIPVVLDLQGSLSGELVNHGFTKPGTFLYKIMQAVEHKTHAMVNAILMWTYLSDSLHSIFTFDKQKTYQIDYGVDTQLFQPVSKESLQELRNELGIPAERLLVVYLGTLSTYQGTDVLLETIPNILEKRPDTHFLIMGYPHVEEYTAMAHNLGIADHVTFTGRINYSEASRYLSLGDMAISTKLTRMEGNGKLLNYLACGLPTVAFDLAGNIKTLEDTGIYVPLEDSSALAEAVIALLDNPEQRLYLGQRTRELAERRYSWKAIGASIDGIYEKVLEQAASQPVSWMARISPHLKSMLRIVVTLIFMIWVLGQVNSSALIATLSQANIGWLALGVVIHFVGFGWSVWRWQSILTALGTTVAFLRLGRLSMVGTFFSMFLPSSIGGDVAKFVFLSESGIRREISATSIAMDRLIGLIFILGFGLGGALIFPETRADYRLLGGLMLACIGSIMSIGLVRNQHALHLLTRFLPKKLGKRITAIALEIQNYIRVISKNPLVLLRIGLASMLVQLSVCASAYCAGQAFGINAPLLAYVALIPTSLAISALPISINALGVQDKALLTLFALIGVPSAQALALSLYLHAIRNGIGILGGLLFFVQQRSMLAAPSKASKATPSKQSLAQ